MGFCDVYNYIIVESSVPLTRNWTFLSSPYKIIIATAAYLYFVLNFGPRYMKNKQPYNLRSLILFYNFIQIMANCWIVIEYILSGWLWKYGIKCIPANPTSLNAIKMFHITWWYLAMKIFDYVETCIFVLRKKQSQVTALHVYHHVSNLIFIWFYLKYIEDERGTYVFLINSFVHVLMYMYYFLAAWSPELQKIMAPFKYFLTIIQMLQFVVIILLLSQVIIVPSCTGLETIPEVIFVISFTINIFIFLYLFYNFYRKSYSISVKKD